MFFFFQAEDGIRDHCVTGVQTCALPISMSATIHSNAVGIWGEGTLADFFQVSTALIENRDNATLSRHIETSKSFIKSQHVGISADGVNSCHRLRFEIKNGQLRIFFARDECQAVLAVN